MTKHQEPKYYKQLKSSSVGLEMGLSVVAGIIIGTYLDKWLGTEPYMLAFWTIAGIGSSFLSMIRALRKAQKELHDSD